MPTYAYRCSKCDEQVEYFQSMSEGPKKKCPACGQLGLVRQIGTGAGFIFKGSGFYQTDYRSDSYTKGAEAEQKASEKAGKKPAKKSTDSPAPKPSGGSSGSESVPS